ncbi:MAG: hypothetical protein Q4A07_03600 [Coriobacteriales bacterium]|nr:hypothetical protein [Coriobacteriales bacterium]
MKMRGSRPVSGVAIRGKRAYAIPVSITRIMPPLRLSVLTFASASFPHSTLGARESIHVPTHAMSHAEATMSTHPHTAMSASMPKRNTSK